MEANTPLWKKLNQARTQGEWKANKAQTTKHNGGYETPLLANGPELTCISFIWGETVSQSKANADFTAIAVNHFANVVEALENFIGCFDTPVGRLKQNEMQKETIKFAKDVLAKLQ